MKVLFLISLLSLSFIASAQRVRENVRQKVEVNDPSAAVAPEVKAVDPVVKKKPLPNPNDLVRKQ